MYSRGQVLFHEKHRGIRRFLQAGVGDPDLAEAVHEPEKSVGAVLKILGAHPPYPAAHFSPGRGPGKRRRGGQQPRHQVTGHEQVHLPAQPRRDVGKGHQFHPAAFVLRHGDHTAKIAVTGEQVDHVQTVRLGDDVQAHFHVQVGLAVRPARLIGVPPDGLLNGFET